MRVLVSETVVIFLTEKQIATLKTPIKNHCNDYITGIQNKSLNPEESYRRITPSFQRRYLKNHQEYSCLYEQKAQCLFFFLLSYNLNEIRSKTHHYITL